MQYYTKGGTWQSLFDLCLPASHSFSLSLSLSLCLYLCLSLFILSVPSHITHIAVSNSFLTVAVLGNSIFRFDLKSPGANESMYMYNLLLYQTYIDHHTMFAKPSVFRKLVTWLYLLLIGCIVYYTISDSKPLKLKISCHGLIWFHTGHFCYLGRPSSLRLFLVAFAVTKGL